MNIVAGALAGVGPGAGWRLGADEAAANHCVAHTLRADGFDASEDGTGRGTPLTVSYCLNAKGGGGRLDGESETLIPTTGAGFDDDAIAFGWQNAAAQGMPVDTIAPTLDKSNHPATATATATATAVRRLMPLECERLQGFPDGYTDVVYRKKPAKDGPRYKAIGNSWAIPPVRWIGQRIDMVDAITSRMEMAA